MKIWPGYRFGRLVLIEPATPEPKHGKARWRCHCDCGVVVVVLEGSLKSGRTTSCGCRNREASAARSKAQFTKHGLRAHPLYVTWHDMKQRTQNPNHESYHNYGGRGITVCDRWSESFEDFLQDMGERSPGLTLDRIDNNGNYEPGNCRWATWTEQRANQRPPAIKETS